MSTIVIDHLARVEGHGGITVELEGDTVANVRFDVFEGARLLEPLVRGKRYDEVAPILSRICSICSVAHTLTSLKATENAFGIRVSPQTELLRELMFRGESIESHALHLFLLARAGLPELSERDCAGGRQAGRRAARSAAEEAGQPDPGDHRRARHPSGQRRAGRVRQGATGGAVDRAAQQSDAGGGGWRRRDRPDRVAAGHRFLPFAIPSTRRCARPTWTATMRGDEVMVVSNGNRAIVHAADYRSLTNEQAVPHSHAKHSTFRDKPFMVGSLAQADREPAAPDRQSWR